MRKLLAICFLLFSAASAFCQTHIITNEVWQDDTIYVNQNLIVDQGAALTINPGTVIVFTDQNFIEVYGQLNLQGSLGDSVTLTAPDTNWYMDGAMKKFYGWGGIYAYGSGKVSATYAVFEKLGASHHSRNGYSVFGVIQTESTSAMSFNHCRFNFKRDITQTYEGCSIVSKGATVLINNSVFKNNKGGGTLITASNSSSLTITNTRFAGNDMIGTLIYPESAIFKIEKCLFEHNKARALLYGSTFNGNSFFEQNIMRENQGAISIRGIYAFVYYRNNIYKNNGGQVHFELGSNVVTGNVFQDNYYGDPYDFFGNDYPGIVRIETSGTAATTVANNTFIGNRAIAFRMGGVQMFNIENNIFHNNYPENTSFSYDPQYLNTGGRTFQHNLLPTIAAGAGNIKGNPWLNDAGEGFDLAANSPAIDNGNSAYATYLLSHDVLGNPRLKGEIDIGATESVNTYVPLTELHVSDTIVEKVEIGQDVARFSTTSVFDSDAVTYSLVDANGVNNNYFAIDGDELVLNKEITTETLLRIKVRADHVSGAWLENYYYLTVGSVILASEDALPEVKVYPNPTEKFLRVDKLAPGMTYSIYSVSGIEMQTDSFVDDVIDVGSLADGIYFLRLIKGSNVVTIKFLKSTR